MLSATLALEQKLIHITSLKHKLVTPSFLSLQNLLACWSLFGHILRRDKDIPANKARRGYFIPNGNKLRPKRTLPIVLNRDLALTQHPIRLHSSKDLAEITEPSTGQEMLEGITITDRESCQSVPD